ncbi:MAG: hypothetical protein JWL74_483 [Alphaproteobacteria bacterium]|jgi:hypothetical protein|nr:hypothetical protein [Alphaproteobacteria bacterium]
MDARAAASGLRAVGGANPARRAEARTFRDRSQKPRPLPRICVAMPRYFFHIRNDVDVDDPEGTLLTDESAARGLALDSARDLVCAHIREHGGVNLDHRIEVADESGTLLFSVTFRDAFTIVGR